MLQSRRPLGFLGAAAIALVVAGCASQGGASAPPSNAPQATISPTGTPEASAGGEAYSVDVHQDATLGAFLTGEDGKSLYLLTRDAAGTSTCTGGCADAWPPFVLESGETVHAGTGVTGTLATIKRPDGKDQVAINGRPLYYFAGDKGPAQTNGQGVNGVWFLAAPDGSAVGSGAGSSSGKPEYGY